MTKGLEAFDELMSVYFDSNTIKEKYGINESTVKEKTEIIEKELKEYQEIREIAKHYNWGDITSEIFNVETDKKYRDLFNSAIVNIQEDYRKARALEIIKNTIDWKYVLPTMRKLSQEEYDLLKEELL